jgi:hypothetical protein
MVEPILCYVSENFAWFTTRSLEEQWGDDWDDAPYEHNAGEPYGPCWHNIPKHRNDPTAKRGYRKGTTEPLISGEFCQCASCERDWNADGTPRFELLKVAFDCYGLYAPKDDYGPNSEFCVKDINQKVVPWLRSHFQPVEIYAGVTMKEFQRMVESCGGDVYLKARTLQYVNAGPMKPRTFSEELDTDETEIDNATQIC